MFRLVKKYEKSVGRIWPFEFNYQPNSLYYAEVFSGPISAFSRPGNTDPFEEMSQRWRTFANTVSRPFEINHKDDEKLERPNLVVLKTVFRLAHWFWAPILMFDSRITSLEMTLQVRFKDDNNSLYCIFVENYALIQC